MKHISKLFLLSFLLTAIAFIPGCGKQNEDDFFSDEDIQEEKTSAQSTPQERIDQYKKLLEIDPADYQVRNNLGVTYAQLKLFEEAVKEFEQVIKTKPDYTTAWLNLGSTYGDMGLIDKAIECFSKTIEIAPQYTKAHQNLGVAYFYDKKYDQSIKAFEKFIEMNNDTADESTFYTVAQSYKHLKNKEKYKEYLKRILEINPNNELAKSELDKIDERFEKSNE